MVVKASTTAFLASVAAWTAPAMTPEPSVTDDLWPGVTASLASVPRDFCELGVMLALVLPVS